MDFTSLMREARRQGWTISYTRSGHRKWHAPDGARYVVTSTTCSDQFGVYHAMQDLRRLGLVYPPPSRKERKALALHRLFPGWAQLFRKEPLWSS